MFYRDEYVVILDRLSRELLIREDDLTTVFGLADKQVRRILADLQAERLVCAEEVTERVRKHGHDAPFNVDAKLAELQARAGGGPKKRRRNGGVAEDSSDEGESSEEEGGAGAAGGKRTRTKQTAKVSTTCYYLNPRYAVDAVRFRLHTMRKHLESLERFQGSEAMYRCSNQRCVFECSLLEAEQRRASLAAQGRTAASRGAPTGIGSVSDAIFSGAVAAASGASVSQYDYTCPLCGSGLGSRRMESISAAAGKLQARLAEMLRTSGISDVLKALDALPLGANRPSDSIKAGLISLHGPMGAVLPVPAAAAALMQTSAGSGACRSSSSGVPGGGVGAPPAPGPARTAGEVGGGRVYLKRAQVQVDIAGEGGAQGGKAAKKVAPGVVAPHGGTVDAVTVPEFLLKSTLTGHTARSFGFMRVGEVAAQAEGAGGWEDATETQQSAAAKEEARAVIALAGAAAPAEGEPPPPRARSDGVPPLALPPAAAGAAGWAYDSNINADMDEAEAEAAPAADYAAAWADVFATLTAQPAADGEGAAGARAAEEEEWEDT